MIFIDEWLPNPAGADAKGEFIELWNNGDAPVNLSGWSLTADHKKKFKLPGFVRANEYSVFKRSETKLALKNTDGKLFLYDAAGNLIDQSAFDGSAPEGESFNRVVYRGPDASGADGAIQQFVWGKPTPGAKNAAVAETGISEVPYPAGVSLNIFHLGGVSIFGFMMAAGMIFAAVSWYAIKKDADISQLFFGGNEGVRP